jgi:hypothetical protein
MVTPGWAFLDTVQVTLPIRSTPAQAIDRVHQVVTMLEGEMVQAITLARSTHLYCVGTVYLVGSHPPNETTWLTLLCFDSQFTTDHRAIEEICRTVADLYNAPDF